MSIICYDLDGNSLKRLYQWDTNQTISIGGLDTSDEIVFHFCNRISNEALVVTSSVVGDKIEASIPNILLQQAYPIIAYLYKPIDEDSGRTTHTIQIPVVPRQKPEDYIYTETEVLNYKNLDDRIGALEHGGVVQEVIAEAIENYIAENPIEIPEATTIDTTLTQEGAAADAKVVGEVLAGKAVKPLIINADNAPNTGATSSSGVPVFTIDYTPSDLRKHSEKGGSVVIVRHGRHYEMYDATDDSARFRFIEASDTQVDWYHAVLDINNAVTITKTTHKSRMETTSGGTVGKIPCITGLNSKGLPIAWEFIDGVPQCSSSDNGKFLRVVGGVATWDTIPNAEEASF